MLLIFGGTGTTVNLALAERLAGGGSALPSILIAVLAVLVLAGPCSRLLGKVAPSIETYPVTRRDLIGCTAILLNDTDEQGGYAQARDREGNVHNITCRTYSAAPTASEAPGRGPLPKGTQVLIIDFEPASNRYAVEKCPDEPAELAALTADLGRAIGRVPPLAVLLRSRAWPRGEPIELGPAELMDAFGHNPMMPPVSGTALLVGVADGVATFEFDLALARDDADGRAESTMRLTTRVDVARGRPLEQRLTGTLGGKVAGMPSTGTVEGTITYGYAAASR